VVREAAVLSERMGSGAAPAEVLVVPPTGTQVLAMSVLTTVPPVELERRRRLVQAGRKAIHFTKERDKEIARAFLAGESYREIAAAVGLSHTGVKKIIDRTRITGINSMEGTASIPLRDAMKLDIFEFEIAEEDE
jgi:FixJ family two-component response regulator